MGKKLNKTALRWTILAIALLQMGGMGLAPSLAAISADMPEVPVSIVQTITSFPAFIMIFIAVIATKLSEKISKKSILLFGECAIIAAGILGYVLHSNIVELYIWAALLGVGFGTILPTCSGILADNFDEQERTGIMGIQSVFTNIGAMYLTYVGGWLAVKAWNLNYLVYLIAILPLVMGLLYIPKDQPIAATAASKDEAKIKLKDLNPTTWIFGAFTFMFMICYGVHSANIAFFVVERNLGTPATIGTIMAICTLGGMCGGATFNYANKIFGTYTFAAAFVVLIIGLVLTAVANSLTLVLIAAVLVGMSISWNIPQVMLSLTNTNKVEHATMACSVGHIGGQIGTFCSAIVMTTITGIFSQSVIFRYIFTAVLCAVLAVIEVIIIKRIESK